MAHRPNLDKEGRGHYILTKCTGRKGLPIYEYQCTKCGRRVEMMQKITDESLQTCPSCKGQLRRLMSLTSFQLKGNGWYATDYKDKDKKEKKKRKADKGEEKADKKSEKATTA
jgi:putative FmdB family regulatory protein